MRAQDKDRIGMAIGLMAGLALSALAIATVTAGGVQGSGLIG